MYLQRRQCLALFIMFYSNTDRMNTLVEIQYKVSQAEVD